MAKQKIAVGTALTGFDHHGMKHRGQTIYNTDYSQETLKQLVQAGFVELVFNSTKAEQEAKEKAEQEAKEKAEQEAEQPDEKGEDADPEQVAGEQSSASPVAPASQEQTAKESDSGEKKKGGKKKK